jgi:translation initiation factor 3 subunit B
MGVWTYSFPLSLCPCRYDEEDEALMMQADADVLQERARAQEEWDAYTSRRAEYVALLDGFKAQMLGPKYAEKEFTLEQVTVEQLVESREEPYKV